jgi:hypothetical protein
MSVPAAYVGLWRRSVIRRATGIEDRSTRVLWFQGVRYHIDLRVPAAPCDPAAQIAFAGITVVEGARCEWRPEIAFPHVSDEIDAGSMRFDAADRLHEAGVDGSYDEDWVRIDAGPVAEQRFEMASGEVRYLLTSASHLAWACGRAGDRYPDNPIEVGFARREGNGWRVIACSNAAREGEINL